MPLLAPDFTAPPGECLRGNSYNLNAGGAFVGNGTFTWNFSSHGHPALSNNMNPTHVVFDTSGVFPVSLTVKEDGCSETVAKNLEVYSSPIADYTTSTKILCDLHPVKFINKSNGEEPLVYLWNFGDGTTDNSISPQHMYPAVGKYPTSLIISTKHNCADTFALNAPLAVNPSPKAGLNVTPSDTSIFYPDVTAVDLSSGASSCILDWGDGSESGNCNDAHSYSNPKVYTVMQIVENDYGCTDTTYTKVRIKPEFRFWIPNSFTPDGDSLNDIFKPQMIGVYDYSFSIYDRWGEKIFETNDVNVGWDGYYNGVLCLNDVFVYKINLKDEVENTEHHYIGRVTLVK
jgi:gliding motility-associated-like protein